MVVVAVVAFVVLGMSESGLGTAWPSMRRDVARPIHDLGTLLVAGLAGYATASAAAGWAIGRWGTGRSLVLAAATSLAALGTYATAEAWSSVLAAAMLLGLGSGLLDATTNAFAAHRFTAGAMNLLHAGFGIGATAGPLVMAWAVSSSAGWHRGYVAIAAAQAAMLLTLVLLRGRWSDAEPRGTGSDRAAGRPGLDRIVVLSLAMFFVYTGVEVAAGQWSFSLLNEGRGLSTRAAGAWVAAYWAGLTVGRLGLSAVATGLGPRRVLAFSMVGSVASTAWFWWNPAGSGLAALPLLGMSLAGVFPTLMSLTPQRLGVARTNAMVGYQMAAASLGAAALPWLIGRGIAATSLDAVGPALTAAAFTMATLHVALERRVCVAGGGT